MKRGIWIIVGLAILGMSGLTVHEASGQKKEEKKVDANPGERVFELRTYWAYPGKMKDLEARFKNHTLKLFEKHGMTVVGFWRPIEYVPKTNVEIADAEFKAARVKLAEAEYREAAERTPKWGRGRGSSGTGGTPKTAKDIDFDLRYDTALREKQDKKNALVAAILNQGKAGDHENKLIYILAFPSREAAAKSWEAFREDLDWIAAKKASEPEVELAIKVESVFMKATDFSPMK